MEFHVDLCFTTTVQNIINKFINNRAANQLLLF